MTIYLDHAATSPMPLAVRERYVEALAVVGNPSSIHSAGQSARALLDESRARIAATLGVDPIEVTFTGGGTEAVNLAVKGMFWSRRAAGYGPRILAPAAEHHATLDAVQWLVDHEGASVEWLPVDAAGRLRLDALEAALAGAGHSDRDGGAGSASAATGDNSVALLTMLWANNEVGTLQPVAEAAALAADAGVPVHVDAIAAYGQVPLAPLPAGVSAVSISAHKKSAGPSESARSRPAAWRPKSNRCCTAALSSGGRSGTMDAAGGPPPLLSPPSRAHAAIEEARRAQSGGCVDRLAAGIRESVPEARLSTDLGPIPCPAPCTCGCRGRRATRLLFLARPRAGFAVSTGGRRARRGGAPSPRTFCSPWVSPSPSVARGSLRVTIGPDNNGRPIIDALLGCSARRRSPRPLARGGSPRGKPRLGPL